MGLLTTYRDLTPQKQTVVDFIDMIDPMEAALLRLLGVNNESQFSFVNWSNSKYEWLEDTLPGTTTVLDADIADGVTTTITVVSTANFTKAHVLKIEDEYLWVSSITNSTTMEVVRGWGGTTAAAHTGALTITRIMTARKEGSETIRHPVTVTTAPYNYHQIISAAIEETGSMRASVEYGKPSGDLEYQLAKLYDDGGQAGVLAQDLLRIAYHGVREDGANDMVRGAGGLKTFVDPANWIDKSGGGLAVTDLETAMVRAWEAGGKPTVAVMNMAARIKISSFYGDSIRTTRNEMMGGHEIDTVKTHAGDLQLFTDRWCPSDDIWILDTSRAGWVTWRPFELQDRPADGDYSVKEYVGEYGFVVTSGKAHARIHNFDPAA